MTAPAAQAKKLEVEQRRAIVAANILAGMSYREIARALQNSGHTVTHETVRKDFQAILRQYNEEHQEVAARIVVIEDRRLNHALNAIWSKVENGDLGAINTMIRVMERRARMSGIDAPTKIAPVTPEGDRPYGDLSDSELAALYAASVGAGADRAGTQSEDGDGAPGAGGAEADPQPA
jgi:hypothetical protein